MILGVGCSQVINSEGQVRLNTIFHWIFVISNILLNYIFISVFHWETQGIAFATFVAMLISSILNLAYFIAGKSSIPVNVKKLAIAVDLIPAILSVGMSSLFYPIMILVQEFVIFNLISDYGIDSDIAFFGTSVKLSSFTFIPVIGLANALQPIIGMNYGANNNSRVKESYLIFAVIGTILSIIMWLPLQLEPSTFLGLIIPEVNFTQDNVLDFISLNLLTPIWLLAYFSNTLFLSIGKGKIAALLAMFLKSIVFNVPMIIFFFKNDGFKRYIYWNNFCRFFIYVGSFDFNVIRI